MATVKAYVQQNKGKTGYRSGPIEVMFGSTRLPLDAELVEVAGLTVLNVKAAGYVMTIDAKGDSSDFKKTNSVEDPGAKLRDKIAELKKTPRFANRSEEDIQDFAEFLLEQGGKAPGKAKSTTSSEDARPWPELKVGGTYEVVKESKDRPFKLGDKIKITKIIPKVEGKAGSKPRFEAHSAKDAEVKGTFTAASKSWIVASNKVGNG